MRWPQLLFTQGFGTRRECEALVASGRVAHDGRIVGFDDEVLAVENLRFGVDGQEWPYQPSALVLLHKPAGFECSQKPRHHPSVLTLLPPPLRTRGVQPVGRLDEDTTGALLLTDDGALIHRLTSPKRHVRKTYEVTTKHALHETQVQRLRDGVVLEDDLVAVRAVQAQLVAPTHLRLVLTEGKYHQVKRMVAAVGNRVHALHRSAFGALTLDGLAPGQWRWVSEAERGDAFVESKPPERGEHL
jgi:16S rRNA pseudouridine516 synthase